MKHIITCAIALALSTTPLSHQDIPLSKILVEKEGWREVAKPFPGVTFLSSTPSGIVLVFQKEFSAYIETNGKVEPAKESLFKKAVADQKHLGGFSTRWIECNWIWKTMPVKGKRPQIAELPHSLARRRPSRYRRIRSRLPLGRPHREGRLLRPR